MQNQNRSSSFPSLRSALRVVRWLPQSESHIARKQPVKFVKIGLAKITIKISMEFALPPSLLTLGSNPAQSTLLKMESRMTSASPSSPTSSYSSSRSTSPNPPLLPLPPSLPPALPALVLRKLVASELLRTGFEAAEPEAVEFLEGALYTCTYPLSPLSDGRGLMRMMRIVFGSLLQYAHGIAELGRRHEPTLEDVVIGCREMGVTSSARDLLDELKKETSEFALVVRNGSCERLNSKRVSRSQLLSLKKEFQYVTLDPHGAATLRKTQHFYHPMTRLQRSPNQKKTLLSPHHLPLLPVPTHQAIPIPMKTHSRKSYP